MNKDLVISVSDLTKYYEKILPVDHINFEG
jgi:hypothetical protein